MLLPLACPPARPACLPASFLLRLLLAAAGWLRLAAGCCWLAAAGCCYRLMLLPLACPPARPACLPASFLLRRLWLLLAGCGWLLAAAGWLRLAAAGCCYRLMLLPAGLPCPARPALPCLALPCLALPCLPCQLPSTIQFTIQSKVHVLHHLARALC
jgi:hypothetical protein